MTKAALDIYYCWGPCRNLATRHLVGSCTVSTWADTRYPLTHSHCVGIKVAHIQFCSVPIVDERKVTTSSWPYHSTVTEEIGCVVMWLHCLQWTCDHHRNQLLLKAGRFPQFQVYLSSLGIKRMRDKRFKNSKFIFLLMCFKWNQLIDLNVFYLHTGTSSQMQVVNWLINLRLLKHRMSLISPPLHHMSMVLLPELALPLDLIVIPSTDLAITGTVFAYNFANDLIVWTKSLRIWNFCIEDNDNTFCGIYLFVFRFSMKYEFICEFYSEI